MYAELDRMLELGVIEESQSPWNSPVSLLHKASTGKIRLVLDARALNDVTMKDAYPMPNIEGILSRLDQTYYISSIDLKDAFWQVELAQDSREKTAFSVPAGHIIISPGCLSYYVIQPNQCVDLWTK